VIPFVYQQQEIIGFFGFIILKEQLKIQLLLMAVRDRFTVDPTVPEELPVDLFHQPPAFGHRIVMDIACR